MSLLDLFAKLMRDPLGGLNYMIETPLTIETAIGWAVVTGTAMLTIVFFVWILLKITGR